MNFGHSVRASKGTAFKHCYSSGSNSQRIPIIVSQKPRFTHNKFISIRQRKLSGTPGGFSSHAFASVLNSDGVSTHSTVTLAASSRKPDASARLQGECDAALSPSRTSTLTSKSCFTSVMNDFLSFTRTLTRITVKC